MKNLLQWIINEGPISDPLLVMAPANELRTCNVRVLNWEDASAQLSWHHRRNTMDATRTKTWEIYYHGHIKERKSGVEFVLGGRLRYGGVNKNFATILQMPTLRRKKDRCDQGRFPRVPRRHKSTLPRKEGIFGGPAEKFSPHKGNSPGRPVWITLPRPQNILAGSNRFLLPADRK